LALVVVDINNTPNANKTLVLYDLKNCLKLLNVFIFIRFYFEKF
jgi:hypothetical protein